MKKIIQEISILFLGIILISALTFGLEDVKAEGSFLGKNHYNTSKTSIAADHGNYVQYDLGESHMTISIPDSYEVCTRDHPDNESMLSAIGINRDEMLDLMQKDDLYMVALDVNSLSQINVKMVQAAVPGDFNQYSDEEIVDGINAAMQEASSADFTITKSDEVYHTEQAKYLKIYGTASPSSGGQYVLQYLTLLNGNLIYISLHSHTGAINASQETMLKTIVDNVYYDNVSGIPSYSTSASQKKGVDSWIIAFFLGLLITFILHPLPILIYRYGIKREPISPKKAKKIVIIDAIIVFVVNVLVDILLIPQATTSTAAIIFWSFICYRILSKGYTEPESASEQMPIKKPKSERFWRKRIIGIKELVTQDGSLDKQLAIIDTLYSNTYISNFEKIDIENTLTAGKIGNRKDRLQTYLMIPSDEIYFISTWTDKKIEEREKALNELAIFQGEYKELAQVVNQYISIGLIFEDEKKELLDEIISASDESRSADLSAYSLIEYKGITEALNSPEKTHPFLQVVKAPQSPEILETVVYENKEKEAIPVQNNKPDKSVYSKVAPSTEKAVEPEEKAVSSTNTFSSGEMVKCRNCGRNLLAGSEFCNYCGVKQETTLFCRKCGAQLPEDSLFCNHCGTKVIFVERSESSSSETIKTIETIELSSESKKKRGFYFENSNEFMTYVRLFDPKENIYWLKGDKYLTEYRKGFSLIEQGHYAKALEVLQNSLILNPIGLSARFEMCEANLRMNKYDQAKAELLKMKDYLTDDKSIARFYRRMGYIEIEKDNYQIAEACYLYSAKFENHPTLLEEIGYIRSLGGTGIKGQNEERILLNANIPILKPNRND